MAVRCQYALRATEMFACMGEIPAPCNRAVGGFGWRIRVALMDRAADKI
jgi:hypothetical protein